MRNKKRRVSFILLYILILALCFAVQLTVERRPDIYIPIPGGWTVSVSGKEYSNRNISDISETGSGSLAFGSSVSFEHILPYFNVLKEASIKIDSGASDISVYLDDEKIYFYEAKGDEKSSAKPKPHIVRLPEDYPDKQLKIELVLRDEKGITGMAYPVVSDYDALIRLLEKGSLINLMTGLFMLGFGLFSLVICVAGYIGMRMSDTGVISAVLTSAVGIWTVLNDHAGRLIFSNMAEDGIKFTVIILAVIFLIIYVKSVPGKLSEKIFKREFESLTSAEEILLMDVSALGLAVMAQIAGEILIRTNTAASQIYFRRVIFFAVALFIATKLYRYSVFVSESVIQRKENDKLFKLAYADGLTGLYNRACWDEKMTELDELKKPYGIVSIDLDGLKIVNDTMGHDAGDRLIKGFARSLSEIFREPYFVARIGGDEFCVILQGGNEKDIQKDIQRAVKNLVAKFSSLDKKEKDMPHLCSCGYEIWDGVKSAHEIYMLADEKMYEQKKEHKKSRAYTELKEKYKEHLRNDSLRKKPVVNVSGYKEETAEKMPVEEHKAVPLETSRDVEKARANLRTPMSEIRKKYSAGDPLKKATPEEILSSEEAALKRINKEINVKKALAAIDAARQDGE